MVNRYLDYEQILQHEDHPSVLDLNMTDLPAALLQASLTLADPASLPDLERELDLWLGLLYAPCSWVLTYSSQDGHLPLIMMEGQQAQSPASERSSYVRIVPIGIGPPAFGVLELMFAERPSKGLLGTLNTIGKALTIGLTHLLGELDTLANLAELCFV